MLDSLLEIEVAYNLISDKEMADGKDPIDAHYEKLKTEISVLDRESEEFKVYLVSRVHGARLSYNVWSLVSFTPYSNLKVHLALRTLRKKVCSELINLLKNLRIDFFFKPKSLCQVITPHLRYHL